MKILLIMLAIFLSSKIEADSKLNNFRVGTLTFLEKGNTSSSFMGSWNPKFYRMGNFIFGGSLGLSAFQDEEKDYFVYSETMGSLRYEFNKRWKAELNAGIQTYNKEIGLIKPAASMSIHYSFRKNHFNIDDLHIGYGHVNSNGGAVQQFRLGIAFHF